MTYYGAKEMANSFRTVRKNTIQIAEDIPESKYDFKAAPDVRSVGQMLVHVAMSTDFAHHVHDNRITDMKTVNFQELLQKFSTEEARPRTKNEIIALLREKGDTFAAMLEGMSDAVLAETVTMNPGAEPPTKSRFDLLLGSKEHEMHHRAQLMLVERMLGIVPHITRQMQARMARLQAAAQPAR